LDILFKLLIITKYNLFSVYRLQNVSVKFIGLNPQDTSVKTKNNNVQYDKLGPIEYSGLSSNDSMIMGVAPFVPTITEITADPILMWTVPKNMSLEEASTVPVPYSMVITLHMLCGQKNNSITFQS
jgi:hypothetical protein